MGVSLAILPVYSSNDFSHVVLDRADGWDLQEAIEKLNCLPYPKPLNCYFARFNDEEITGYGEVTSDEYGEPLKYTVASELKKLPLELKARFTAATWAYLMALNDEVRLVLYWT